MNNRNVLIVDDHVELAENLAEIIAGWGFRALTAASAEEGLLIIGADPSIHALLTDYRLPGLNGAQLITELRHRGNRVPAIVISAFTDQGTVDLARAAGAVTVLAKPVDFPELMSALSSVASAA